MWNINYDTNECIYKTEIDSQTWRTSCGCQEGGRHRDWEIGISRWKLLQIGWINNKVLLYSMRTIFNILINHNGKENGKEYEKECMVDSLVSDPPGKPHMYV